MTPKTVIAGVDYLLSMPDAALQLLELLGDPDSTLVDIADVISIDPSLSARVLRVSSSAYFGLFAPVETISQAVSVIGTSKLHALVFATSASTALSQLNVPLANIETFWQHSVRAALAAGSLAARGKARDRDRIFLAALLHDIGQLVMYHQLPEISKLILNAVSQKANRECAERELIGFTHAQVGAELLEFWKLPVMLTEPVRYHENSREAPTYKRESALVQLGSAIAHRIDPLDDSDKSASPGEIDVPEEVWQLAGCQPHELEQVMLEVEMNWFEVLNIIAPSAMTVP